MKLSSEKFIAPILVALITAAATLGAAVIEQSNKTPSATNPSATPTSIISKNSELECNKTVVTKPCIANVTIQINSDEPRQIKNYERVPLKAGDTLRLATLRYCIPPEVTVNKVEVKAYLFPKGTENYKNGLFTSSSLPTYTGCHIIDFEKTWKVESGQHQVTIPIIKYDGTNRIVDKNFYFSLDVGQ